MTLQPAARNAACNAIVDLLDVGTPGDLVFTTAEDGVLATMPFAAAALGHQVQ